MPLYLSCACGDPGILAYCFIIALVYPYGQSTKSQAPNHKQTINNNMENDKRIHLRLTLSAVYVFCRLEFVVCLAFDAWCLEF
jgi:hypothetical protein